MAAWATLYNTSLGPRVVRANKNVASERSFVERSQILCRIVEISQYDEIQWKLFLFGVAIVLFLLIILVPGEDLSRCTQTTILHSYT